MSAPQPVRAGQRWRRWLLEGLLVLAVLAGVQAWRLGDSASGPAPAIHGQLTDGRTFDLATWRAEHLGQPLLLYFWAEWCAVCKTTAGNVSAIASEHPVLSIAIQSGDSSQVAATLQAAGYAWPTLPDPQARRLRDYGLPGVPAFVVIDPQGHISHHSLGYTSEYGLRWALWRARQTSDKQP